MSKESIPFPYLQSFFDDRVRASKKVVFDSREFEDLSKSLREQIDFKKRYQEQTKSLEKA